MNIYGLVPKTLTVMLVTITLCGGWVNSALAEEAESTEPAAGESITVEQAPVLHRYGNRAYLNRSLVHRKAAIEARRKSLENWRSLRRWWNNPMAEDRRQWNKARNRWFQNKAEARSSYYDQFRPPHDYEHGYSYRRIYP
ncbi:MAG: hypothetical protein ABFS45_22295 [Pseudomonadota bacterium]